MIYSVLFIFLFFLLFVQRNWDGWKRWSVKSCVKQPLPAWQRTPYLWQEVSWHTESAQDSRCQRKLLEDEEKIWRGQFQKHHVNPLLQKRFLVKERVRKAKKAINRDWKRESSSEHLKRRPCHIVSYQPCYKNNNNKPLVSKMIKSCRAHAHMLASTENRMRYNFISPHIPSPTRGRDNSFQRFHPGDTLSLSYHLYIVLDEITLVFYLMPFALYPYQQKI